MRINRIKLITMLEEKDMTQKQLAEKTLVSRVTINGIVKGRSCSDDVGLKISKALDVDIKELLAD